VVERGDLEVDDRHRFGRVADLEDVAFARHRVDEAVLVSLGS